MKLSALIIICCFITSCSKFLEVDFVNLSGKTLNICSHKGEQLQCSQVANNSNKEFIWGTGNFEIRDSGEVLYYKAVVPNPPEEFLKRNEPVRVVVTPKLNILIVPLESTPGSVSAKNQPKGWPIEPHA